MDISKMLRSGKKLPVKEETAAPKGNPLVTAFKAIHDEKEEIIACKIINDSNTIVTLESETETPALSAIMIRDQDKTVLVKEKLLEDQLTATHRGDYYFTFPIKKGAHPVATAWDAKTNKLIRATKYKEHNLWRHIIFTADDQYAFCIKNHNNSTAIELRTVPSLALLDTKTYGVNQQAGALFCSENILFRSTPTGFERWTILNNKLHKLHTPVVKKFPEPLSMTMLADKKTIVTGHENGCLRFWQLDHIDRKKGLIPLSTFKGFGPKQHLFNISGMIAIPDGQHLVTWHNSIAYLWDISNQKKPVVLNQTKFNDVTIGVTTATLTEDWGILTNTGTLIEFPKLRTSFDNKYKEKFLQHTCLPNVLIKLTTDHLGFFASGKAMIKAIKPGNGTDLKEEKMEATGLKKS